MTPAEVLSFDLAEAAQALRAKDEPFAFATIVRTAGSTAAKPGAKALLGADGAILRGWLGGGCTRGAVKQATLRALEEGRPQLVSVTPEDMLEQMGVTPGEEVDGTRFARNGCPSRGTVDIFIEPCLPTPQLLVLGASPVAQALAELAPRFHWAVENEATGDAVPQAQCVVVATQGQGDLDALKTVLARPFTYVAFVGSARKFASLSEKLMAAGLDADLVARVKAPAGLNIDAVTPEEIALSILAELVQVRRVAVVPDHE
ncbi:XdhC /CoxI family-like protein [Loktanella sp. D2R18]|uniref:XdhC family protein n=1 Tax=Rhodobacterales TaxID=204455 RepID=UPI000DEBD8FB|nr:MULTISPECIES: XdhC family protein [Rhodobacterales]MDO6589359.1 XdhC family protein [Yoonia sp. 1_MG-2023]RBW45228.1 XdhC /CoxI family-like protein [Loktanella sp. D2R18]